MTSPTRAERCPLCNLMCLDLAMHLLTVHKAKRSSSPPHALASSFEEALASNAVASGFKPHGVPRIAHAAAMPSAATNMVRHVATKAPAASSTAANLATGKPTRLSPPLDPMLVNAPVPSKVSTTAVGGLLPPKPRKASTKPCTTADLIARKPTRPMLPRNPTGAPAQFFSGDRLFDSRVVSKQQ